MKEMKKKESTYPRDVGHSVDGNFLLAVQTLAVLDGPAVQMTNDKSHRVGNRMRTRTRTATHQEKSQRQVRTHSGM